MYANHNQKVLINRKEKQKRTDGFKIGLRKSIHWLIGSKERKQKDERERERERARESAREGEREWE